MKQVVYAPEVVDELYELIKILVNDKYLSTYELAESYAQDIVTFIETNINFFPAKKAPLSFSRYGVDQQYMFYKRNNRTTWYILFETHETAYLVTHITNNHVSAHLF